MLSLKRDDDGAEMLNVSATEEVEIAEWLPVACQRIVVYQGGDRVVLSNAAAAWRSASRS